MKKVVLALQLKKLMTQKKVSARALAKATGIPSSSLNNILAGRASSKPQYLLALCEYFSCSWEYLVFGVEPKAMSLESLPGEQIFEGLVRIKIEKISEKK